MGADDKLEIDANYFNDPEIFIAASCVTISATHHNF